MLYNSKINPMKINSNLHGLIDYAVVLFLLVSPKLFGLPTVTADITYALAIIHFTLTIFTKYEAGYIKLIPYKIHGIIELVVSVALIGIAFYLGNMEGMLARNFYIGFSAAVFVTWALTDYKRTSVPQ